MDLETGNGRGELDFLHGGDDADVFTLGQQGIVFYADEDRSSEGFGDYACIAAWDDQDQIRLAGTLTDYRFVENLVLDDHFGLGVFWLEDEAAEGEFIALIENASLAQIEASLRFL